MQTRPTLELNGKPSFAAIIKGDVRTNGKENKKIVEEIKYPEQPTNKQDIWQLTGPTLAAALNINDQLLHQYTETLLESIQREERLRVQTVERELALMHFREEAMRFRIEYESRKYLGTLGLSPMGISPTLLRAEGISTPTLGGIGAGGISTSQHTPTLGLQSSTEIATTHVDKETVSTITAPSMQKVSIVVPNREKRQGECEDYLFSIGEIIINAKRRGSSTRYKTLTIVDADTFNNSISTVENENKNIRKRTAAAFQVFNTCTVDWTQGFEIRRACNMWHKDGDGVRHKIEVRDLSLKHDIEFEIAHHASDEVFVPAAGHTRFGNARSLAPGLSAIPSYEVLKYFKLSDS